MIVLKDYTKDPDAKLPYGINWAEWLADVPQLTPEAQTIAGVEWITPGLTLIGQVNDDTKAIAVLGGGTAGGSHYATCRITTSLGYQDDRTIKLKIKDR